MRSKATLLVLALCSFSPGCALIQDGLHNIFAEVADRVDDCRERARDRQWAEESWAQVCSASPEPYSLEYAEGFKDGFVEYLFCGKVEPPPIAPARFRSYKYQTPEGYQAIEQWFAGYRRGVAVAIDSGYRRWITAPVAVPLPHAPPPPPPLPLPPAPLPPAVEELPPPTPVEPKAATPPARPVESKVQTPLPRPVETQVPVVPRRKTLLQPLEFVPPQEVVSPKDAAPPKAVVLSKDIILPKEIVLPLATRGGDHRKDALLPPIPLTIEERKEVSSAPTPYKAEYRKHGLLPPVPLAGDDDRKDVLPPVPRKTDDHKVIDWGVRPARFTAPQAQSNAGAQRSRLIGMLLPPSVLPAEQDSASEEQEPPVLGLPQPTNPDE